MITEYRLNSYHVMWLFVFFDLPTTTKNERKHAAQFRKALEKDGFTMMQYCPSKENRDVHVNRVKLAVPDAGLVSIMAVTDKQYGEIVNLWGKKQKISNATPLQLELF